MMRFPRTARLSATLGCGALLCACAAGRADSPSPTLVPVADRTGRQTTTMTLTRQADLSSAVLSGTPADVWPALVAWYGEAGLPVTGADGGSHVLRTDAARLRRIADQPVSRFFDCAGTAYGNSAGSGELYVTVNSQLVPAGRDSSELRLRVEA
ncbi:MAG: hypothetical protein P8174_11970, partial [Gemmatimonadota bacterium]